MYVVDPAKSGRMGGRAMVARGSNANKRSFGSVGVEDGIDTFTNSAKGALKGIQGFRAKVKVTVVKRSFFDRFGVLSRAARPNQLFTVQSKS
jgi:hypothetical protein